MASKLQELTEKIYAEGVTKAKTEAEKVASEAQSKAEQIISNARKEAEKIVKAAKNESEDMIKKANSEMTQSSKQALSAVKQKITELITAKVVENPVKEAMQSSDFLKKAIETTLKNWKVEDEGINLSLLLPAELENELSAHFKSQEIQSLSKGLEVSFHKSLNGGFKIGPADDSYKISFSDDDFSNFFKAYLRPKTVELLYGKGE